MLSSQGIPFYQLGQNIDFPYDNHPLFMRQPWSQFYDLHALATAAENYDYLGVPIPNSASISFTGRETKEGTVTVFSHAYLVSMSGYSEQPEGFAVSIRDKGAKDFLFSKRFLKSFVISDGLPAADGTRNPSMLLSPYIALSPGQYDWVVTNQSASTGNIQVYLEFVIPVNKENRNNLAISN